MDNPLNATIEEFAPEGLIRIFRKRENERHEPGSEPSAQSPLNTARRSLRKPDSSFAAI